MLLESAASDIDLPALLRSFSTTELFRLIIAAKTYIAWRIDTLLIELTCLPFSSMDFYGCKRDSATPQCRHG